MSNRAVLFDIGSTLVSGPDLSPSKYLARLLGLPAEEYGRVSDIIMRREFSCGEDLCAGLASLVTVGEPEAKEINRLWLEQETAAEQIPGATLAVARAIEQGFKVGLVSDIWAPYYRAFTRVCPEIASQAECAVLSFREGVRKPSVELVRRALAALDADPARSVMVGDTYENDLQPAMELGLKTVWVLCRPEREYRAMAQVLYGHLPRPDVIVPSIMEFANLDLRSMIG